MADLAAAALAMVEAELQGEPPGPELQGRGILAGLAGTKILMMVVGAEAALALQGAMALEIKAGTAASDFLLQSQDQPYFMPAGVGVAPIAVQPPVEEMAAEVTALLALEPAHLARQIAAAAAAEEEMAAEVVLELSLLGRFKLQLQPQDRQP